MSDFIHEPVPQVVVVQDPNTGANVAVQTVNSDMLHRTPEQSQDMAELKAKQTQERAEMIMKHHEEQHTNVDGDVLLGEAFIQARDEGDGIIVIPKPPERILTRPPTQEELDNVVPYRASTVESEKAAVDDLRGKKLITEERQSQWNQEIDKIADDVPNPPEAVGTSVAAKDEGQGVSPPPYSNINGKDYSEAKTENPETTPATATHDPNDGTVTVSPDESLDPRSTPRVTNVPTEGVNVTTEENDTAEKVVTPTTTEPDDHELSNTTPPSSDMETPVLKLGE